MSEYSELDNLLFWSECPMMDSDEQLQAELANERLVQLSAETTAVSKIMFFSHVMWYTVYAV